MLFACNEHFSRVTANKISRNRKDTLKQYGAKILISESQG